MMYHIHDLLKKMGAPEAREKKRIEWHFFDRDSRALAGYAEIRLEAGGEFLVAELKRLHENYEDDNGQRHTRYEETFFMYAERTARADHYRITRMSFDGEDYGHPTKPIIELGLSVFHARALDISIRMVEQSFNKQDMLAEEDLPVLPGKTVTAARVKTPPARVIDPVRKTVRQEAYGVVVPFRPRIVNAHHA